MNSNQSVCSKCFKVLSKANIARHLKKCTGVCQLTREPQRACSSCRILITLSHHNRHLRRCQKRKKEKLLLSSHSKSATLENDLSATSSNSNSDDEGNDEEDEDSVFIKQEALEPEIEMVEEDLDFNDEKVQDNYFKVKHVSEVETIVPEAMPVSVTTEPPDVEDVTTSLRCPKCDERVLESHLMEDHGCIKRLQKHTRVKSLCKLKKVKNSLLKTCPASCLNVATTPTSAQVQPVAQSVSLMESTSQSGVTGRKHTDQYLPIVPAADNTSIPECLPVTVPNPEVVSSSITLPSLSTSILTSTIDSSEGFFVSMREFPKFMRIGMKKKMLEVVKIVKKFKVSPENIVIAYKSQEPNL